MTSPISTDDICAVVSTGEDDSDVEGEPFVIIEATRDDWDEAISSLDARQVEVEVSDIQPEELYASTLSAPCSKGDNAALAAAERKLRALLDRR